NLHPFTKPRWNLRWESVDLISEWDRWRGGQMGRDDDDLKLESVSKRSVDSTGVVALKGRLPLADADSRGADSAVVVGVGVGRVVEEAESLICV
nr:hypothetical protein [Tanacetum cinerariifolium]